MPSSRPLSEEDITKVYGALEVMERFKGQGGFSWIEELSAHLRTSLHMGKNPLGRIYNSARSDL